MTSFALAGYRNDTIMLQVIVTRNSVVVDITNATLRFVARKWANSAPLIIKTTDDGIEIIDGPNGTAIVTIAPDDTLGFVDDITLHCAVELTEINGRVTTVATGTILIALDIAV